jgi:hypothetical protein
MDIVETMTQVMLFDIIGQTNEGNNLGFTII